MKVIGEKINCALLTLMPEAGRESAILDRTDKELHRAILAAEAVLGLDRCPPNEPRAFRAGLLE